MLVGCSDNDAARGIENSLHWLSKMTPIVEVIWMYIACKRYVDAPIKECTVLSICHILYAVGRDIVDTMDVQYLILKQKQRY